MNSSTRVIINTGFLYGKMLITMILALYSTRLILVALGEVDFGIFMLVGGVIGMLSFLNSAMTVSTQRYLSYHLGAGEKEKLITVFRNSTVLHLFAGVIVVVIIEICGIFLFEGVLKIPAERIGAAKLIFHFMVVSTFFTINAVPYDAAINAHENMLFDSLTGIFESFCKLGFAIWLISTKIDQLILYGLLTALLTIIIRIVKSTYCLKVYPECRVGRKVQIDRVLMRDMFSFAGWNLFGAFCNVIRNQGLSIILNLFFGIVVNAAYGIANQVNGLLSTFSSNMLRAINPQIMKSEGGGDRNRMLRLSMVACKMSFLLIAFFSVPLIIEMPTILKVWLKEVPLNTVAFCRLIIVLTLTQQITIGLMPAIQSIGRIRKYQMVVGMLLILNLPVSILLIKLHFPSYTVLFGSVFLELVAGTARISFAKKLAGLKPNVFAKEVLFKPLTVFILTFMISLIPVFLIEESIIRVLLVATVSVFSFLILSRIFVLDQQDLEKIREIISKGYLKFIGRQDKCPPDSSSHKGQSTN